ncbi:diphosphomevalonate decarboxylase [Oxyplasma meridianum]|uniref:Diphosphomevalonate decarboxylase n=1 Tax=Oxyplasma meridianum TaxID=3073602 RepID=A0AAX4NGB3_9ARCH
MYKKEMEISSSTAFPTIGIVLLGGISDQNRRIPMHDSAGIAYSDEKQSVRTVTSLYISDIREGYFNGNKITPNNSYRSPFRIIEKYESQIFEKLGIVQKNRFICFRSENHGILSGSSDSGAAALGKCIHSILGNDLNLEDFENDLRSVSESVGRSFYGGLTVTETDRKMAVTRTVADWNIFKDFTILGCPFPEPRKPSDTIHENIVKSNLYEERVKTAKDRVRKLESLIKDGKLDEIFEIAQEDTEDYHRMIESVGVKIINRDMRNFIEDIKASQKEFWSSYIVTGGTNVFVVCHNRNLEKVMDIAVGNAMKPLKLKISPGAKSMDNP